MNERSAVGVVDELLAQAIDNAVSDIHLEQTAGALRVRFRIDGVLQDQEPISADLASQVIGRLKVLSRLNITHKRVPQDGKLTVMHNGNPVDVRISTFPSCHGEKVVVRILDTKARIITVDDLGMNQQTKARFLEVLARPHGLFLVTGPTGSGKTTTLYAMLQALNKPDKNIVTLEDPVEYTLQGVTQAHINPAAGFTFESGMRSVLRQDPDIIMVGEIRDKLTARTAIEAALTGHLVLSTLHTNDAPSAVMRLMDMGIEPYLINATLIGVLAQRLVRTICSACRQSRQPTDQESQLLLKWGSDCKSVACGSGCAGCRQSGLSKRIGIFELLIPTPAFRSCVVLSPSLDQVCAQASVDGMQTLIQDGAEKISNGAISVEELSRSVI